MLFFTLPICAPPPFIGQFLISFKQQFLIATPLLQYIIDLHFMMTLEGTWRAFFWQSSLKSALQGALQGPFRGPWGSSKKMGNTID